MTDGANSGALSGKIIKGIGGFYYIYGANGEIYECRARGIFRKAKQKPLPGDNVLFVITDETDMEGSVVEILPRTNSLIRPEISNADQALLVFAVTAPEPNLVTLDKLLISVEAEGLKPVICFNKTDLASAEARNRLASIYRGSGHKMLFVSAATGEGIESLKAELANKTTVLMGNSGVGKSSLVNTLCPEAGMETGSISEKLGRGRHTTRYSELFFVSEGTYIMDTPGFSAFDAANIAELDIRFFYEEFTPYYQDCRFNDCVHIYENDCGVKSAAESGCIPRERYENYREIYNEILSKKHY